MNSSDRNILILVIGIPNFNRSEVVCTLNVLIPSDETFKVWIAAN